MFGISGHSDNISIVISRSEVESCDIDPALETLKTFVQSAEIIADYFEKLDISFYGYDQDPRELFEIPEVRKYVYKLDEKFPYWLFFLSKSHFGLQCLLLCFLPPHLSKEAKIRLFPAEIERILAKRWFPAMDQICKHVGFSDVQVEELMDRVVKYIAGSHLSRRVEGSD
ncbi:MAG: hypothetical protein B7Z75_04605 [Acidocella sp. 20-57-95]|nr:MAG: hypothetical protein B7Z75_04605 [Acidocella sp. 20-57-95]HQT64291.1 chlororespiratory reduction 6 domain-containing protein [Acidocella sp.]